LNCASCGHWLVRVEIKYGNGDTIIKWSDPQGRGKCTGPLADTITAPDFGCIKYEAGEPIVQSSFKEGNPWNYWTPGPCPDCGGRGMAGDGVDDRCCGTGQVRYYDDGFIGDNRSKMHPKEKPFGKRPDDPTPVCFNCYKSIDQHWNVCPYCGTNLKERQKPALADVL